MDGGITSSMVINLFPSPGSKSRLAGHLVNLYPPHVRYVEPFAGGAACFWGKTPSPVEVLNDYDGDIVTAYKVVRDMTPGEMRGFMSRNWLVNEATFNQAQQPTDDILEQVYRFVYRRRASFMARENRIARGRIGKVIPIGRYIQALHHRLQGVEVLQGDGLRLLKEMDTPETFFFIDPPWPGYFGKWKHYTMDSIRDLADALVNVKEAKWMWAETPTLWDELPRGEIERWNVREISMSATGFKGRRSVKTELLMSNYPI